MLDAILAHVPVGITIARAPDVTILRVSEAGSALLQRDRSRLENIAAPLHPDAYQVSASPDGPLADTALLPLTRATCAGEIVRGEEWYVSAEDGRRVPILCNAGPIRDGDGAIIGGIIAWADISRQKRLEAALRESIATGEALLDELHHRIANHLQLVSAVVQLETRGTGDEAQALGDRLQQRIAALAGAYASIRGVAEGVRARQFLDDLCRPLQVPAVRIEVAAEDGLEIGARAAPTLGIIVNEAICNALKHGYPDGRTGIVRVTLRRDAAGLTLEVRDDGVGLGRAPGPGDHRGSKLMARLAQALGGEIHVAPAEGGGARLTASFPGL